MGQLGYNTRGPLVDKLKSLLNDVQGSYEAFLDAHTLYQEGKMDERTYFIRMGDFLRQFSSLGFLMVKVILELDASIGRQRQDTGQVAPATGALVRPSPSIEQFAQMARTQSVVKAQQGDTKTCMHCNATIPARAKFCPRCGKQQIEGMKSEGKDEGGASAGRVVPAGDGKEEKRRRRNSKG